MARKFGSHINLAQNEIQNAVAQVLSAAPSTPVAGQFYYDSTIGRLVFRGASIWIDPTDRARHTGTQPASSISDFDTQVRTNRIDQMAVPTVNVSFNSQRITTLADPVGAQDAATKAYVDSRVNGTDWKDSVRVATTANLAALSGLLTIDTITLAVDDRVAVKNQTASEGNGIYLARSGAWVRATDADTSAKVTSGMSFMVTEGATQAGTQWRLNTPDPIVLGTTGLSFGQIGAGTSYTEGTGIDISGNVINIDTAVVVRKFSQNLGSGTSIAVNHNLNTLDITVQVYEIATGETIECDQTRTSVNQVTLGFAQAIDADDYRVVVHG